MTQTPPHPPPGYQPPAGQPPSYDLPPGMERSRSETCGLAIASLICGIAGITCFSILAGIPAVVTGHLALGRIKRAAGALAGRGIAIAGLVLGYISIGATIVFFVVGLLLAILSPAVAGARASAQKVVCRNNLHQIGLAILTYADEHDSRLPDSLSELVDGKHLPAQALTCPAVDSAESISEYVYKGKGLRVDAPNASSTVIAHDREENHRGGCNVLYLDGHVEWKEGPPPP